MEPSRIEGFTREIGKPRNWDDAVNGECGSLAVRDYVEGGLPWMQSAWTLSPEELEALQRGAPVYLQVQGQVHPVVSIAVGLPPE